MRTYVYLLLVAGLLAALWDIRLSRSRQAPHDAEIGALTAADEGDYVRVQGSLEPRQAYTYTVEHTKNGAVESREKKVLLVVTSPSGHVIITLPDTGHLPFPATQTEFAGRLHDDAAHTLKELGVNLPGHPYRLDLEQGPQELWPAYVLLGTRLALLLLFFFLPRILAPAPQGLSGGAPDDWSAEPGRVPGKPRIAQAFAFLLWIGLGVVGVLIRKTGQADGAFGLFGLMPDFLGSLLLLTTDSVLRVARPGVELYSGITGVEKRLRWEEIAQVKDQRIVQKGAVSHKLIFVLTSGRKVKFSLAGRTSDQMVEQLEQRRAAR